MRKHPAVNFIGEPSTVTGYGNATINMVRSFIESDVSCKFSLTKVSKQALKDQLIEAGGYTGPTRIAFYMHPPPFRAKDDTRYKIGYFYWETDTLPKPWGKSICRNLDEVWVPCRITMEACRKAGFRGPIEIVQTPAYLGDEPAGVRIPGEKYPDRIVPDGVFKFYSVFQWNDRKGYNTLLESYYSAFDKYDNVLLVLKVNPIRDKGHGLKKIYADMERVKRGAKKRKGRLPKVFLTTEFLERRYILGLHKLCDAFVLPHNGEGWGMPIHDAMLNDSLVITTKFGGITEYLSQNSAFLIDYEIGRVKPMSWNPWYTPDQRWAYPDKAHLSDIMRDVYLNRDTYDDILTSARNIAKDFTIKQCSVKIEEIFQKDRFRSLA